MRQAILTPALQAALPRCSVLGFGCAAVMGRVGRKDSLRAMDAAWNAGINFFDTARSYGYGESERLLGEFLKGRRESAVICTKFGILPSGEAAWKRRLKPAAQMAIKLMPSLRSAVRQQAAGQVVHAAFSVELLKSSFEKSLRELRTDYVDLLLLHAAPASVLDSNELMDALGLLLQQGKVRVAGISGTHAVVAEAVQRASAVLTSAQFAMDPGSFPFLEVTRTPEAQRMLLVANHPFGGPGGVQILAATIAHLSSDHNLPESLREKLTPGDPLLLPEIVFGCILTDTGISAVVPAMMRVENVRRNVAAVQHCRFTPAELAQLRDRLTPEGAQRFNAAEGDPQGAEQVPSA